MKVSRGGFYSAFTLLLALSPVIMGGCDLINTSLADYFLDNSEVVEATGFTVKTEHALSGGAILIPPGEAAIIGVALANPRNLDVRQELLGAPEGKDIALRQNSPGELELRIAGSEEGDQYDLTLLMQSADGLRDFPSYPLRVRCVSFETALQDFTIDGATPPSFDPGQGAFRANVPNTQGAAVLKGTTIHPGATIAIYAGTDDSGELLASGTHEAETASLSLELGGNQFYIKISAPSGTVQGYALAVYRLAASDKWIEEFYFVVDARKHGVGAGAEPGSGSMAGAAIAITLPHGTATGSLTAMANYVGASISPDPAEARSYAAPVAYTVTAADGSTATYTVTVSVAPNSAEETTDFYFTIDTKNYGIGAGVAVESGSGKIEGNNITITVPYGTDVSAMTATASHSGASISFDPAVAQSYAAPVTYTVTAGDGSTGTYTVTVQTAKIEYISYVHITDDRFTKTDSDISGDIKAAIASVDAYDSLYTPVTLDPADYSVDALIPAYAGYLYATMRVPGSKTSNGVDKTRGFSVYIYRDTKTITEFRITDPVAAAGTIDETLKTIAVTVPYGTDLSGMKAWVSHTGDLISLDPEEARSYAGPVKYTVTAEDGTTATYTVTVTAPGITITVTAPENLTALTFSASNATAARNVPITITITESVTVDNWHVDIEGSVTPASSTGNTVTFAAPGILGFYNINVIAKIGEIDYSGSFGLIVQ